MKLESIKNKGRILAILQYLYKNTDEDNTVTTNELIEILSQAGYTANRKTIKDDIDIIVEAGFDVILDPITNNWEPDGNKIEESFQYGKKFASLL